MNAETQVLRQFQSATASLSAYFEAEDAVLADLEVRHAEHKAAIERASERMQRVLDSFGVDAK